MLHFKEINTKLQGENLLTCDLYHAVGGFHGQLEIWESQLREDNTDIQSFPTLCDRPSEPQLERYANAVRDLEKNLKPDFMTSRILKERL